MRLREWVKARNKANKSGKGEVMRLCRVTGLAYITVLGIANEKQVARFESAVLISKATKGKVSIVELCTRRAKPKARKRAAASGAAKRSATAEASA
jgi:hypothetical protein